MELSVREAATALGVTTRTVRGWAESGRIPAKKRSGRWVIDGARLDLGEPQRRALQQRAQRIRDDVDAALPVSLARTTSDRSRSVVDLDAFRLLTDVVRQVPADRGEVQALLDSALCDLAEAVHVFHLSQKRAPADRARRSVARAVALLHSRAADPPPEPISFWIHALEAQVIPALGGYLKWIESEDRKSNKRRP